MRFSISISRSIANKAVSCALICFAYFTLMTCVSKPLVPMGLQSEFKAISPSRVLALPLFLLPNPSEPAQIDLPAWATGGGEKLLETQLLEGFKNQPGVNGVSFQSVRRALGSDPVTPWFVLKSELDASAKALSSTDPQVRAGLPKACLKRKSVLDFYVFCVSPKKAWLEGLNALSAKVLNADTALVIVVTHFEKSVVDGLYSAQAGLAALLVDTNTGRMIWGRQAAHSVQSPADKKAFPAWETVFAGLFSESFWEEFPGRVPKTADSKP